MDYTLINENGSCGGIVGTQPSHNNWTLTPYLGGLIKEFWNGSKWVENATQEEIDETKKYLVPETLHRMGLKIQLLLKGIEISEIIDAINSIPDSMFPQVEKQIAIIKFEEAKVFLKFLEKDNALILTTNLNNSEFLNHLIELSKNKISLISLLEIGKKSIIQSTSNTLLNMYNEIKNKIKLNNAG